MTYIIAILIHIIITSFCVYLSEKYDEKHYLFIF